jgi:hypothetical protein
LTFALQAVEMKETYSLILLMSKQLGDRWSNGIKPVFSMHAMGEGGGWVLHPWLKGAS